MNAVPKPSRLLNAISWDVWKYFYRYLIGYRKTLAWSSIGYISLSFFVIPNLLIVKYIFDDALPNGMVNGIVWSGVALTGLRAISVVSTILLRKVSLKMITSIVAKVRTDLLQVIYGYSYLQYARLDIRRQNVQMVQDTERISGLFVSLISRLGPSLVISLTLVIILFWINPLLFAVIAFFIPLITVVNFWMGRTVKLKTEEYQEAFEDFSNSNMFILKYLGLIWLQSTENFESVRQKKYVANLKLKTKNQGLFGSFQTQLQTFMVSVLGIAVLVLGGILVTTDQMSLGDFFAFYIAANQLNNQLNAISSSYSSIISGNVSLEKLYKLFHSVDHSTVKGKVACTTIDQVQLHNVWFDYGGHPVISDLDLTFSKGDIIGIIGPNGSGKSTLIQLILGFIKPHKGEIHINGMDYQEIDVQLLRRNIGVVTQHPMLLPGTIRMNIEYGVESIDTYRFNEAVQAALVTDFVEELPDSYGTEIGEDGSYLSGGERQKIAMARALIRRPDLVILDEPTNHLDGISVKRIMDNLRKLPWNPTIIIISHDEAVVSYIDEVYEIIDCKLRLKS